MTLPIPDLWSDDIRVDVLTPVVILRSQAQLLGQKTQGILNAEITTTSQEKWRQHQLDIIAPLLNGYRATLLTAKHERLMVYPVLVRAKCFIPREEVQALFPQSITMSTIMKGLMTNEPPPDQREASTQDAFIELVRQVLQSDDVRAMIQSLIARSNEANNSERPEGGMAPEQTSSVSDHEDKPPQ